MWQQSVQSGQFTVGFGVSRDGFNERGGIDSRRHRRSRDRGDPDPGDSSRSRKGGRKVTVVEVFETIDPLDPAFDRAVDEIDGIVVSGDATPHRARRCLYNMLKAVALWGSVSYRRDREQQH